MNAKRVYRLYDEENLTVRSVERKKIARRQRVPQGQATGWTLGEKIALGF